MIFLGGGQPSDKGGSCDPVPQHTHTHIYIYIYIFCIFCAQRGCNIFYNVIHPCDGKAESEIIIIYRFKKQLFCVVNGCAA